MDLSQDLITAVPPAILEVEELSQVGQARRAAAEQARQAGLDESRAGDVAIVASELATNLYRHAREGLFVVQGCRRDAVRGVELLALDRGPGLELKKALVDGYSTGGTPGTGLGAVTRLASAFDAYSRVGVGTGVLARLYPRREVQPATPSAVAVGAVAAAKPGEEVCGDTWAVAPRADGATVLVSDGLGHGPFAAAASWEAVRAFAAARDREPAAILERVHEALRDTRGAAVAVARIDAVDRTIRFAGVGNISASVRGADRCQHLVSMSGILGMRKPRLREFAATWPAGAAVILHTDGLDTHWRLDALPGLLAAQPALLAGVLFAHHRRLRDDATIVALVEATGSDDNAAR